MEGEMWVLRNLLRGLWLVDLLEWMTEVMKVMVGGKEGGVFERRCLNNGCELKEVCEMMVLD